jgi:serine/threonine protein kinase
MSEAEFPSGSAIGAYRVVEPLGVVGLAERYRVVAPDGSVRVLGLLGVNHPDMARGLTDQALTELRHPNVVPLVEVVQLGRRAAVVTGPLSGVTLKERLASGPVSDELALSWFRGLLDGLEAAHRRGLVHRDLRPETILVDGDHASILDLGVASAMFALVHGGRSVTTSGTTIGRPHYWAPERARRPQSADGRSDLFSLGCVLYEMFAGVGPFAGLNLYDCYHATLESRFPPLAERRKGLPPHVGALVGALLRARPEQRPQSCAEVREILDGVRPAPPSTTPAPPTTVAPPPPRPPPRWPLAVTAALFVALLAGLGWLALG